MGLASTVSQEKQIEDAGHRRHIQNIHRVQKKELHPYRSATCWHSKSRKTNTGCWTQNPFTKYTQRSEKGTTPL